MDDGTSEQRVCKICGKALRKDNATGICGNLKNPACRKARKDLAKQSTPPPHRIKIEPGVKFGRWAALETYQPGRDNRVLMRCECGTERRIKGTALVFGKSKSCGCGRGGKPRPNKPPYIPAGSVFGRLTVLEDVRYSTDRAPCLCLCGTKKSINAIGIKAGHTQSCGCISTERRTTLGGFSKHPLYALWNGIIDRTTQPNHPSWDNYGGRGIGVCDRWRDPWAFAEDIERVLGPRPADWSLDRIDNERGYEPGNVRWADRRTQRINQRSVATLTRERDALAFKVEELERALAEARGVLF